MRLARASGILLHPTSLPGPYGVGDLGPSAEAFAEFLSNNGQTWWQMLPLGPPVFGSSPYQAHSSQAGNPILISPERMVSDGLLSPRDLPSRPISDPDQADFAAAADLKKDLCRKAYASFRSKSDMLFDRYCKRSERWLDDFALYMACKTEHGGSGWNDWQEDLALRKPDALERWRRKHADEVRFHQFVQYVFDNQWRSLRNWCRLLNVGIIGDVPIFVAQDSAEVWTRPDLFQLDTNGRPTFVAGVPPDYFNEEGQLWGNPVYRWEVHEAEGFAWWIDRLGGTTQRVDYVRLDHFRGFEAYWRVPASALNAVDGKWIKVPGYEFLSAVRSAFGGLPLLAEDLGHITEEVEALRDQFGLPGMKVLQFAFGRDPMAENYLPYRHPNHSVVYTGTHDNDTTYGWFHAPLGASTQSAEEVSEERRFVLRFTGGTAEEVHWALIRSALGSPADTVIIPLQDVLGLGSEAQDEYTRKGRGQLAMEVQLWAGEALIRRSPGRAHVALWKVEQELHAREIP